MTAFNADRPKVQSLRIYGRLSFPHLLEPQRGQSGMEDSYSCTLLLPPDTDLKPLVDALEAAGEAFWGGPRNARGSKWPLGPDFRDTGPGLGTRYVIRKCEEKGNLNGYDPGWHFISFRRVESQGQPDVVGGQRDAHGRFPRITDPREVYPGRWAVVSTNAFAFSNRQKGLSFGLNNVQLRQNDKSLGGKPTAESEFDDYAEDAGDDEGY